MAKVHDPAATGWRATSSSSPELKSNMHVKPVGDQIRKSRTRPSGVFAKSCALFSCIILLTYVSTYHRSLWSNVAHSVLRVGRIVYQPIVPHAQGASSEQSLNTMANYSRKSPRSDSYAG